MKVGSSFLSAPVQKSPDEKLHEVSDMYEKHFLREMLKSMRSTVHEGGFIKTNQAEKIFREQLDDKYVDTWSEKGGIGLSKMIYTQLVEKFGAAVGLKTPVQKPMGPLAIDQKSDFTGSTFNSVGKKETLAYRFDKVSLQKPELGGTANPHQGLGERVEVKAPWSGTLLSKRAISADENVLEIAHDNGLKSRLVYRGTASGAGIGFGSGSAIAEGSKLIPGQEIQAGEVVGYLSPEAKSVFWNVEPLAAASKDSSSASDSAGIPENSPSPQGPVSE